MSLFCRHNYETLDKTTMPSLMDIANELKRDGTVAVNSTSAAVVAYRRKLVITMRCAKCGKVKIHTVTNP